ncbi:MFS transporter [Sulfitobacter donghicola]|uniref:MFS transporter n=1 Tax=Sulfitobacter donghicola DSW-25 = KCTC 12864 = JCM 14565 TaxID=1300350 RepID=A0A073ILT1_9RHOB|nr:MFS transporter [Sulfitobacter donghicola]KEJ90456.1 MFS transporter [Sulfitobacter donghicola DSW-25 = KCTC 12864 = JCM 14565]KIN67690.1 Major facilitator superfamily protein [Sulfitobacter donghicola DSW-25 = KCTC 12864 = JCM 14565]
MNTGIALLAFAYVLSQFFRAFLAVLSPFLATDIGATPEDLAFASGLWFLTFAAIQPPVGWALDTIGPRRTAAVLLLIGGGGGAAVFAMAIAPAHVAIAMALIGIGCAPVLMASYYIFALDHPPARFAFLAALMVGVGTLGNIVASYPTTIAAETVGWRASLWGLAAISCGTAIGIWFAVRDPVKEPTEQKGSFAEVLRIRALWFIFPLLLVSYAEVGALRGLWIGPYLTEVFHAEPRLIGQATLAMGIAMVIGPMAYSPLDRIFNTRKWVVFVGSAGILLSTIGMLLLIDTDVMWIIILMCAVGFFGSTYPALMAHGRSLLPRHLVGRGVTVLNLCSVGGVGIAQVLSGRIHSAYSKQELVALPYTMILLFFAVLVTIGLILYLFSTDTKP